jgi:hypothetical protein
MLYLGIGSQSSMDYQGLELRMEACVFRVGLPGPVEIPAIVQQADLPPVFVVERAHQLVAKPLWQVDQPFPSKLLWV